MTNPKQTSVVVRETFEVSTKPQFGHRLISRAADDAIGFIPSPENVIEQKSTIRFMSFDFGEVAAIEGSLGMIWSSRSAVWKPSGGSKELAFAVLTDEGSKKIPSDEVETTLLGLGAPMPSFVVKDEPSLLQQTDKLAILTYEDGSTYYGEVKDGLRHGQGTMAGSDGRNYVGEWKDGKPHGQGRGKWANGDMWLGEFKDAKPNGKGIYTWHNGEVFEGHFQMGKRHGIGTQKYIDGTNSVGKWIDGNYCGVADQPSCEIFKTKEFDESVKGLARSHGLHSKPFKRVIEGLRILNQEKGQRFVLNQIPFEKKDEIRNVIAYDLGQEIRLLTQQNGKIIVFLFVGDLEACIKYQPKNFIGEIDGEIGIIDRQ